MSRLNFTSQTKRSAYNRSNGICECYLIPWLNRPQGCGVHLVSGAIFYEHINPNAIRPDNSLDNCAVLTRTCWREKTDKYDRAVIAKSNHSQDRARGIGRIPQHVMPGSRASGLKKRMDGTVERRNSAATHS